MPRTFPISTETLWKTGNYTVETSQGNFTFNVEEQVMRSIVFEDSPSDFDPSRIGELLSLAGIELAQGPSDSSTPPARAMQPALEPENQGPRAIYFYNRGDPYYEFTNFSPHDVVYKNKLYPTSEHLFQALKFLDHEYEIAREIRTCESPRNAFNVAQRNRNFRRKDWINVSVSMMEKVLRLKFTQHSDLRQLLLDTGDAELVENSPVDYFWGIGADGSGRNELGKALQRVRSRLHSSHSLPR